MRAVIQRVKAASCNVEGEEVSRIGEGMVIFLAVKKGDGEEGTRKLAEKIVQLRIFSDEEGRFNRSILDVQGEAMVISQFTLYADCRRGRRPSFHLAEGPEMASYHYENFIDVLKECGLGVQGGVFGKRMGISVENDGPVTIILDTEDLDVPRKR